jgi:hypothetical protein
MTLSSLVLGRFYPEQSITKVEFAIRLMARRPLVVAAHLSMALMVMLRHLNAVAEGLDLARRYDTLASKSESELARLGLRREDIARAALAGRGR